MSTIRTWALGLAVAVAGAGLVGMAQEKGGASATDPRASLKPGLNDAQKIARNIELLSTLGKPSGFFDPKAPSGRSPPAKRRRRRRRRWRKRKRPRRLRPSRQPHVPGAVAVD
jgi:hypothetical protein